MVQDSLTIFISSTLSTRLGLWLTSQECLFHPLEIHMFCLRMEIPFICLEVVQVIQGQIFTSSRLTKIFGRPFNASKLLLNNRIKQWSFKTLAMNLRHTRLLHQDFAMLVRSWRTDFTSLGVTMEFKDLTISITLFWQNRNIMQNFQALPWV
jgi:hypothetical protein